MTFEHYKKNKETDRTSKFKSNKVDGRKKAKVETKMVKVQVGLLADNESTGHLKKGKGRTIPVLLSTSADADCLLTTAVEKHGRHFKQFNKLVDYVLLYPDMSVVKYLPGNIIRFTLQQYRDDILKPYSKLYFWLCEKQEYENTCYSSDSDDADLEKPSIDLNVSATSPSTSANSSTTTVTTSPITIIDDTPTSSTLVNAASTSTAGQWSCTATISSPSTLGPITTPVIIGFHQCPTYFSFFTVSEIETHADECAEAWVDPIGALPARDEMDKKNEEDNSNSDSQAPVDEYSTDLPLECITNAVNNIRAVLGNISAINRLTVIRSSCFKDYLTARRRKWFKPKALLKVSFIVESAVDDGGPRREFLSETFSRIKHTLFDDNGLPYPDMRALANEEFKAVGELMACSIIQGGPAPCLLATIIYDYIVDGVQSIQLESWLPFVGDITLKESIEKIGNCKTDEELHKLLTEDMMVDMLQTIEYRGVPSRETLLSSKGILRSMVIAGIAKLMAAIDQMIAGLISFGGFFLDYIRSHKKVMEAVFTIEGAAQFQPTSELLLHSVKTEFSEDGSNLKADEVNVFKHFSDYVMDLEEEGGLSKLYKFITGSATMTPLGLEKQITVKFCYGFAPSCKCRPVASTCEQSIILPLHYQEAAWFEEAMNSALNEGFGFGQI